MSYRDKLAGVIPGAFEAAFRIDDHYDDETDDDVEPEVDDGVPHILLTRAEKLQIRAPWRNSLIVRLMGKPLEHRFFKERLLALWKPKGGVEIVDIGNGFYTVTF